MVKYVTFQIESFFFFCSIEEILQDSEDESDDEEEKAKGQGANKAKRPIAKRGKAWLKEGGADDTAEPLDFLDPSISKRVLGKRQMMFL